MKSMKSISLIDEKNAFLNYLAQIDSVLDLSKAVIDFLVPMVNARSGNLYLNCRLTQKIKLIYQTSVQKPEPMHAPKNFEILFENDQAIIPILNKNRTLGTMIFQGVKESSVLDNIEIIKSTLPFFNLKIKGLIERELLENKIRIIDQYQLSYELSEQGTLIDISAALASALGYESHELLGKDPKFFKLVDDIDANAMEEKIVKKDGSQIWVKTEVVPAKDLWGDDSGRRICFQQNISREKMIEEMAIRDELTKLYNRRFFNQTFSQQIDIAKRNNHYFALMIIDIDNFKKYNDTYGHQEGDRALTAVAHTISQCFKRKGDYAFRLGGEEFGVICNVTHPNDAEVLADFCRQSIMDLKIPHTGNANLKFVTISTGLVTLNETNLLEADEVYKIADIALYEAKSAGRNCVKVAGQVDDIELF